MPMRLTRAGSHMRRLAPTAALLAAALFCPQVARAAALAGTYASPLGDLVVSEKDGVVTGKVVDAGNVCGFPKGTTVLDGSRLDDSITGNLRVCKMGDGCAGPADGAVMLLVTKNGALLSGAVHLEPGKCKTPIEGDGVALQKLAGKKRPPPKKKPKETASKVSPRKRAEALATEALQLIQSGAEGSVEEARQKLQEAVAVDPDYAEGHNGIGVTFSMRQRYDEALESYKKAIEVNPNIPDPYYNIACVYAVKNDVEQAMRYLRIAVLNGYVRPEVFATDADLKNLHGNPEFEKLKGGG